MAQPLTTDNLNDAVKRAIKTDMDDLKNRVMGVERIVQEDLQLDRGQQNHLPDYSVKIDQVYSKIEELRSDINILKGELKLIREQLAFLVQKSNAHE